MSTGTDDVSAERSREEKLKSLIRRDIDPQITSMAEEALCRIQEESS